MSEQVEHEICGNCKKEIPQQNYVMHTVHCSRKITLCQVCKEPIPKEEYEKHKENCLAVKPKTKKPELPPPTHLEKSQYFQARKLVEDKKITARKERQIQKFEKFLDVGHTFKENGTIKKEIKPEVKVPPKPPSGLLACKFCDLELPKLELEEHENYCGSRTDKCLECGELVMFKYKQIHMDSNHGFLKLKDEPGPRPSWDSTTQRSPETASSTRQSRPLRQFSSFDSTFYSFPQTYSTPPSIPKEKGESYKEISRRLDCPAPMPPPLRSRRPTPPSSLTVPCEFCGIPVPPDDLIEHETGCRPDLARYNPRRRRCSSPDPEDFFLAPPPTSPEVELPCEFCSDLIPASQLLRHQSTCI